MSTLARFSSPSAPATPVRLPLHNQRFGNPRILTTCSDRATALEALRRSQYKFPGRQKIIISKNWGFTPLRREEYLEKRNAGHVKVDGAYVKFLSKNGSIEQNVKNFPEAFEA